MRVLILGGYGVFGGRLARLLSDVAGLEMLICGRDSSRAEAFCHAFPGQAAVLPLALDRADIAAALERHQPDVLVDASGPFQDYGDDRYRVVSACIAARVHYLDFADAADFVFGISQFDEQAKAAGVFVLSGVSSFPVLTAAVLREMAKSMELVDVEGGIAPSPFAGIGINVMRAVVGYAGSPVKLLRKGQSAQGIGLAESRRQTIAVPGLLPLRNIRFSLVEVPDLLVLPPEHESMQDIWMGAGPVPEILHRMLNLLAKLRHALSLPSLVPFSRLFYLVLNRMRFGEHRGGMYIRVRGTVDGRAVERSWHLLAEGDDGPFIPSMAIEAIIRKMLGGEAPQPGARPAVRALELADYRTLFRDRNIHTGFREERSEVPIYQHILGPAFDALPQPLQQLHGDLGARQWAGRADVERGQGLLAPLVAAIFGFPKAGRDVPVTVRLQPEAGGERWVRDFGGKRFSSLQSRGSGRDQHLLVESFGPARFSLALVMEGERLLLIPRRWSLFGIPMPGFLLPRGTSFETVQDEKFSFDVDISMPLIGRIVRYQGTLEDTADNAIDAGQGR